jgi:hypothetical protein
MHLIYIYLFFYRRGAKITTNQIAVLMEELDDSFHDPDYEDEKTDSNSDSEMFTGTGDKEEEPVITLQDLRRTKMKPVDEIRVNMVPPVGKANGDTEMDSGRIFCRRLFGLMF